MGPILPQINVFGKQLGISPDVMGFVTSVLPILYVLAKPIVGYLIDYFPVSGGHTIRLSNSFKPSEWRHFQFVVAEYAENDFYFDFIDDDTVLCRLPVRPRATGLQNTNPQCIHIQLIAIDWALRTGN